MKRITCVVLLSFLMLTLAGCWDKLELEEQAFVVVLGLDKAPDNLVAVTFQIANPQVGSSDKGAAENEPPSDIITITAPDVLSAKELANSIITRTISFAHLRTLIISQDFAEHSSFHHIVGASVRDPEMRREIHMLVSKEKAAQFIHKNKSKLETRPHKYYQFMQERWRDTGFVPNSTLNRYFQRIGEDTLFLAIYATTTRKKDVENTGEDEDDYRAGEIPAKSGDPAQMMGSAIFRSGTLRGILTGEETRIALLLRRKEITDFITSIPDPLNDRYRLTVRLFKDGDTRIKMNLRQDPIAVQVTVPMRVQVLSIPSLVDYRTNTDNQSILRDALEDNLRSQSEKLVEKLQRLYRGEPFLWHLHARKEFWTLQQYEQFDWPKHYVNAQVRIAYELEIQSFGKQASTPKVYFRSEE
jgi:spore germination protein KC